MMVNLTHYLVVMLLLDVLLCTILNSFFFVISSNWMPIVRILIIFDDAQIRQLVFLNKK